ncbi:Zinc finger and SCAN domain-containing protein 26 [Orchesella cincta]|uniref:Zinc finger and SCAN domain-containing protein 26 n=1 Tax=Orchesella cincta TaxID=48709 RepID=A0A1D2M4X6_ORCCI|nr:Zinc finger and SCAN domain-containing protein 26 [Orchesella cincta]
MSLATVPCLFCASPCSPVFTTIDGRLTRLKSEVPGATGSLSSSSLCFLETEENSLLAQQLQVIFILRDILKLKDDKITQFLGKLDGGFNPEFWIRLCQSCESAVKDYFVTLNKVNRLQKKLLRISEELKVKIEETEEAHQDSEEEDDAEKISRHVWKEIREETLLNLTEPEVESPPKSSNFQNEQIRGRILVEGDIRVEFDEKDGSVRLDVPDLSSLRQILGLENDSSQKVTIQEKPSSSLQAETHSSPPQSHPPSPSYDKNWRRTLTCDDCPYFSKSPLYFDAHRELHQPGSSFVICTICGWFLNPKNLKMHIAKRHPKSVVKTQPKRRYRTKPRKKQSTTPKRSVCKCSECGALFHNLLIFKHHQKLHEKGEGVNCSECGWLILASKLVSHTKYWHPEEENKKAELRRRVENYSIREIGGKMGRKTKNLDQTEVE